MPAAEREQLIRLVLSSELDREDGPSIMGMYHRARVYAQPSPKRGPNAPHPRSTHDLLRRRRLVKLSPTSGSPTTRLDGTDRRIAVFWTESL
jgi:hypothetical protein